jgi:hypothetical protein
VSPADLFWLAVVLILALTDLAATYAPAGDLSFSARVRYWSGRRPALKAVYVAGALALAYHWWG